jgi:hypothetical protein
MVISLGEDHLAVSEIAFPRYKSVGVDNRQGRIAHPNSGIDHLIFDPSLGESLLK